MKSRASKDIKFIREAEGPGQVFIRGPKKSWPGPNSAQPPYGRSAPGARRSTAAHPFSPRGMSMRQAAEREWAAGTRKALGIKGPQDSRGSGRSSMGRKR